jgi:ADP-dependent NAD(P)H-hydrate dehydratase
LIVTRTASRRFPMSTSPPYLPPRDPESHKGDYGRLLLVGGSRGMSGAIALAGLAALRCGAGLVRLATADVCLDVVAGLQREYMTIGLPSDRQGRVSFRATGDLLAACAATDVVALGPGLGRSLGLGVLVSQLYREVLAPMVVDADALNALAERGAPLADHRGPRIITPHPGEFGRLVPESTRAERPAMEQAAARLAGDAGIVVVLKGHCTFVTDGREEYRNATGNPGMATGGTGDVLTGVISAFLGAGLSPFISAQRGVLVHGLAGDLAAERLGEASMLPTDLVDSLSGVLRPPV